MRVKSYLVHIGSGVIVTSLASNLVAKRPGFQGVVVDPRSLCSGATGHNGKHIKTATVAVSEDRKRLDGTEKATRLTAFEHSHLDAMISAVTEWRRRLGCLL